MRDIYLDKGKIYSILQFNYNHRKEVPKHFFHKSWISLFTVF